MRNVSFLVIFLHSITEYAGSKKLSGVEERVSLTNDQNSGS